MIKVDMAKRIKTFDLNKNENGFLIELSKDRDKTTSYLSCAFPGAFKGYHLHTVREANYVCVRGRLTVIMYTEEGRQEVKLMVGSKLHIPINVPTGLKNDGDEEAWIINFPNPPYDPTLKDEQVDYTEEQCENGDYLGERK